MALGVRRARSGGAIGSRGEAIAGYLFIAIPMGLFLVLNVGSIFYALFISVWKWNIRLRPTRSDELPS